MIVADVGAVSIVWADGRLELLGGSEIAQARVARAFSKPARAIRSREMDGGGIERYYEKVAPGTTEHARAVLLKLRASITLDSE